MPPDALDVFPLLGLDRDDPAGACVTFPEMDAAGYVIGLNRRFGDSSKKVMRGSKRGLTLPIGWRDSHGPTFVAEGPTDAAALTAAGLSAIDRPSNSGGVEILVALFRDPDWDVVILGENDQKASGKWPGRHGALSVARRLANAIGRPIRVAFPPAGVKDVREWLTAQSRGGVPWAKRGAELLAYLTGTAMTINPTSGSDASEVLVGSNDGPDNPHRLAAGYLAETPSGSPLRFWRGDFYRYFDGAYHSVPDGDLRAELTQHAR